MLAAYLVLVLYNGFLALSTGDVVYRYYLLILVGALVSLSGKYALPSYIDSLSSLTGHIHSLGGLIAYAATPLFFGALFAELKSPAIRRISAVSFISVMLFIPALLVDNSWALQIYSQYWVGFLFVLFWWSMLAVAIKHKHPLWKVAVLGWAPVTLGTPLYVAYLNGWLPASFRTAAETSSLYEAFIFSIAMAYRIKIKDQQIAAASARLALQSEHIVEIEQHESALENTVAGLKDTEKKLRAEKAKQAQLFAIIGHELRTPASALQMLLHDQGIENLQPHGRLIDDTVKHLLNVLDDMRIVTQPDLVLESPEVKGQVPSIVVDCLHLVHRLAAERGLEIQLHVSDEARASCILRAQLLRQIVLNLVKNCALHAKASRLNIRIDAIDRDDSLLFMLMFSDNGRGIRPDHQDRIFEAFERSDSESDGTGLGLHISRTFARNIFKGDLTYRDNDGGGAVFTLTAEFPKRSQTFEEAQVRQLQIEQSNVLQGLKILFAEDSVVLRMMTTKQLEKQGVEVIAAADGREALRRAEDEHFDLLLTDIFMPEIDGYELTRVIRERGFSGPVVGVSAAVMGEEVDALKRAGANQVLSKPLAMDKLKAFVAAQIKLSAIPDVAQARDNRRARVLIVDDDPISIARIEGVLAHDYLVQGVASAFDALEPISSFEPDILLTDINMPGMNGFDLIREVRHIHPDIPVIGMSSMGDKAHYLKIATAVGAVDVVDKSSSDEEFLGVIKGALKCSKV